ncbi:hypothetical protein BH24ACT5_BH24ACT5_31580 [soil metagenome]
MSRRGLITGAAVVSFVIFARVAAAGPVELWHEPTRQLEGRSEEFVMLPSGEELPGVRVPLPPLDTREPRPIPAPFRIADVAMLLVLIAAAAAVVAWRRVRDSDHEPFDALADGPPSVAHVAAGLIPLVSTGLPRDAIVACWVELERELTRAGYHDDPAETSSELTTRVLETYTVDQPAIHELAALYREARFSTHETTESHRASALAALVALQAQLDGPTQVTAAVHPP